MSEVQVWQQEYMKFEIGQIDITQLIANIDEYYRQYSTEYWGTRPIPYDMYLRDDIYQEFCKIHSFGAFAGIDI